MAECTRNIELFFLLNRLIPDFRTISDFRKDNAKALRNVFREFSKICLKLNLYEKELIAIDGSKFRAVNSKQKSSYNENTLKNKIARIDENIARYLSQMDEEDKFQQENSSYTPDEIKAAIEELKNRKEKYMDYISELEATGETQKLTNDPEARVMQSKDGFHCCYNVQTAVDEGSHLIADYVVTNSCTDQGLLKEVADKAREALEVEVLEVTADKGYDSRRDIEACVMDGIIPNVPLKYDKEERIFTIDYEEAEISEEEKHSTKPEDIQKCIKAGVLPSCYENTSIEVEVQEQTVLSCFTLNNDGTVTCPMGNILTRAKLKGPDVWYRNKDACRQCPNKCTGSRKAKTVSFGPGTTCVPARMYGSVKSKLNPIPDNAVISPNNHTLDRKDYMPTKKVVLKIKEDIHKTKERMCLSEHPFGTVKWHHGAHYLLCKGKEKATAELGLSFLAYNMKRAINLVGIQGLMAAL